MTPAIELLERLGLVHQVLAYDHDPKAESYGGEAAESLGLDPESVFKTLLAELDDGRTVIAVVPVSGTLDLKGLARAAKAKRARMANPTDAERITGSVLGGISPFGSRKPLPVFVDETATILETVHVSAGRRGLEVAISPEAFEIALDATFAPLAADSSRPNW